MKLRRRCREAGWISHPLEPALFMKYDGEALAGLLLTHVDDLLYAPSGPVYEEAMSKLREDFRLKL